MKEIKRRLDIIFKEAGDIYDLFYKYCSKESNSEKDFYNSGYVQGIMLSIQEMINNIVVELDR